MNRFHIIMIFTMLLTLTVNEASSQVRAVASIDSSRILIGDQVHFFIEVNAEKGHQILWPVFSDTLTSAIQIINQSAVDSVIQDDGSKHFTQMLTITAWDSGYFAIPPIRFNYNSAGDPIPHFYETDPLLLEVMPLKVDMQADIKDIKEIIPARITFKEILPYLLIVIFVILLGFFLYHYFTKKATEVPQEKPKIDPKIPPHVYALDALDELEKKKLWQNGHIKSYYSELTEILRTYLELQFVVYSMEMTTPETIAHIRKTDLDTSMVKILEQILNVADMVKFAKWHPTNTEHEMNFKMAYDFVRMSYNHVKQYDASASLMNKDEVRESEVIEKNVKEEQDV